jgi:hypothetical protein
MIMLETVIAFGFIISLFEFVVISMIPVRTRLRMLGSPGAKLGFHLCMFCINMLVHWGTAVGTMSATLAFICSIGVIGGASKLFGFITEGRYYTVGFIRYSVEEIK